MIDELFGVCPITTAQKILSGKWALLIIYHLKDGALRFSQLQRLFDGITHTTLAKQLKTLESYDIVERKVYSQIPPKVEYSLSELGEKLLSSIDSLHKWGEIYIEHLELEK